MTVSILSEIQNGCCFGVIEPQFMYFGLLCGFLAAQVIPTYIIEIGITKQNKNQQVKQIVKSY